VIRVISSAKLPDRIIEAFGRQEAEPQVTAAQGKTRERERGRGRKRREEENN